MFRGNCPARVDDKGRLKLPADFKNLLSGGEGEGEKKQLFYITSKDGKRAEVWPLAAWEEIEAKLAKMPNSLPAKQKFLDETSYYGAMAEMDVQGRVLIPQVLRDAANVGKGGKPADVVVFGKQKYLEVANREAFEAERKPLTAEDFASLAEFDV
jgi:MraZ protein